MTHPQAKARHADLAAEIREHDYAYYVEAMPRISDRDYDQLYPELRHLRICCGTEVPRSRRPQQRTTALRLPRAPQRRLHRV